MSLKINNNRKAPAGVLLPKLQYYNQGAVIRCNNSVYRYGEDNNSGPSEIVFPKPKDIPQIFILLSFKHKFKGH